jgi:AcrR family transcriptional regulator
MKRITNVKRRPTHRTYDTRLRDEQSAETRQRILDALVRTMGHGVAGLSIPAVAKEAGVSVPTVYRHFKTKAELVAALAPYLFTRSGLMEVPDLGTDDFRDLAREFARRSESMDAEVRAAMASELGHEMRQRVMPERLAIIRKDLARRIPGLSGSELDRFTRVTLLLLSSAMTRAYKDYLGMDANDAAEDVGWALETLRAKLRRSR